MPDTLVSGRQRSSAITTPSQAPIPPVLAGPILRRVSATQVVLWLATRSPAQPRVLLAPENGPQRRLSPEFGTPQYRQLQAAPGLHYLLLALDLEPPLSPGTWVDYQLELRLEDDPAAGWQSLSALLPGLVYPGRQHPGFRIPGRLSRVLHGSCRKPHHDSGDGLAEGDRLLARALSGEPESAWPDLVVMSGDQIYADDVAGPMLQAIHQVIQRLQWPSEDLKGLGLTQLPNSEALYRHHASYYAREELLPEVDRARALTDILFGGVRKPVFTSDSAHNHLITLAEYMTMYLLVWSPEPWKLVSLRAPSGLKPQARARYEHEWQVLQGFQHELEAVRRLMAHLPVAMVFDDHDISDDWNLSREWEEAVYGNPFSRRMVGNGLIAYLVNQGWGNAPEAFSGELLDAVATSLRRPGSASHDELIDNLLRFEQWDYQWDTVPPLIVMDTRTRRWRSESAAAKPSGLLDWEALTDLQQRLRGQDAVILVAPAPIFGVKLIEVIQRIFTWCGFPLMVDAENWMAHRGTAHGILNVFRHPKTPQNFVVLSGDVHYSFVYDVELRGRRGTGPHIWQICSSGVRNRFPARLLEVLDRLNRRLYSPRSPLNWFTRRRWMRVIPRKPRGTPRGRRLLNEPGLGLVELDEAGRPWRISELLADGRRVEFERREAESRWD
ncbi:alkaline phosphatase family protein [Motiliproteus sp. SC1-56]|uniref:alkaline phosphatase family protein n=1 Tax=Motiliproteus sp. SC1-56 TaxID=2799565 RepID=UPI001F5E28E4|nr:alkaline phosphatase family protein [Motiliproteus sp. SC1-56]